MLSEGGDFVDIDLWAEAKIDWLRGFMKLEHGIPSYDTIGRVFGMIASDEFESAFRRWAGRVVPALAGDTVVAIDGKTSRRSGCGKGKTDASQLQLVSAFTAGMGAVLGQTATAEKSNEITAIPELLAKLAIEGCVVTIYAMGTQTQIARTIRERGAHYVLCVKGNHPKLHDLSLFADIDPRGLLTPSSTHETMIKDHGRIEVRRCRAYAAIDRICKSDDRQDLASFAVVKRIRTVGDHTSTERVFYTSSLPADAGRIARAVRSSSCAGNEGRSVRLLDGSGLNREVHAPLCDRLGVRFPRPTCHRLHWCLDVQFNEDQSRVRSGYAANNQAIVRRIVMNLLRFNTTRKASIKSSACLLRRLTSFAPRCLGL